MSKNYYEVIVIGAGIMGSATAYYLSRKYGKQVLLVEQFDTLHRRGSSHGESRIIRMTYPEEYYTSLMPDAFKYWTKIEKEANTKLLTLTGGLDFGKSTDPDLQALIASCKLHGVFIETLTPKEVKKRFPTINLPADFIGVYSPDAGILNATKCVATLQCLAKQHGCNILDNIQIVEVSIEETTVGEYVKVVSSTGEEYIGKKCVVTAGPWTQKLLKNFDDIKIPLQPVQTTVAYWTVEDPEAYSWSKFPVFINYEEPLIYGMPALEYPNMIKISAHFGSNCDPDTRNFQADAKMLEVVGSHILSMFSGIKSTATRTESCLYTETPDGDFVVDQLSSNPNIYIGCGFSGHGFKLAPVIGKILAEWVIYGKTQYPEVQKHFSIARFKGEVKPKIWNTAKIEAS